MLFCLKAFCCFIQIKNSCKDSKQEFTKIEQKRLQESRVAGTRQFLQAFTMFHSTPARCRSAGLAVAGVAAEQGPARQSQQGKSRPKPLSSNPSQSRSPASKAHCNPARQAMDTSRACESSSSSAVVSVVALTVPCTRAAWFVLPCLVLGCRSPPVVFFDRHQHRCEKRQAGCDC